LALIDISEALSLEGHMEDWSEQEKWVWERVSKGEIADFNRAGTYGGLLDPRNPKGWPESRILTPEFLETILLRDPYREALTHKGVKIFGAWFKAPIDLSEASLPCPLKLLVCRFDSNVYLRLVRTPRTISVAGSKFAGELNMNGLRVGGNLEMGLFSQFNKDVALKTAKVEGCIDMAGAHFNGRLDMDGLQVEDSIYGSPLDTTGVPAAQFEKEVVFRSVRIGGQIDLSTSTFKGKLNMNSLQVGSHLFMQNEAVFFGQVTLIGANITGELNMIASEFKGEVVMDSLRVQGQLAMSKGPYNDRPGAEFHKEVDLTNATVGTLSMIGSTFKGKLDMNTLHVKKNLLMKNAQFDQKVDLLGATVGGQVSMIGSTFKGKLDMEHLEVGSTILLKSGSFEKPVDLAFATVGGSLELSGTTLSSLKLTSTRIKDQLRLSVDDKSAPKWTNGGELFLSNTDTFVLQDSPNAWPKRVEMTGFTYSRLGSYEVTEEQSMAHREVSWMKAWLQKQPSYSPQPYVQLGKVLKESGFSEKAKAVLYAAKERERKEAKCLRSLLLGFLNITIGHGYYTGRLLVMWALVLWIGGVFVLWKTGQGAANGMPFGISYSLDMLLPVVRLNEAHYGIKLIELAKYYFYVVKIGGWVLVTLLVAGMSGITKH